MDALDGAHSTHGASGKVEVSHLRKSSIQRRAKQFLEPPNLSDEDMPLIGAHIFKDRMRLKKTNVMIAGMRRKMGLLRNKR